MRYFVRETAPRAAMRDLRHPEPRVRVAALEALGRVEAESVGEAIAAVRPSLDDDSPDVRYMAALTLGQLRDGGAVERLIDMVREDPEPMPRQAAISALGRIGDDAATDALLEALAGEEPDLRFQAAAALPQVNPGAAAAPLCGALADRDAEVRASAAAALGDLGDTSVIEALVACLDDVEVQVRMEAGIALSRLGDERGRERLVQFLGDQQYGLLAAEQLFRHPGAWAAPALRQVLQRWLAPKLLKVWAAAALARLGDAEGRRVLLAMLRERNEMVRGLTLQLLGELGEPWGREALEALTGPAWAEWSEEIAEALGRIAPKAP
jgi:HEAT repeat protein